jgi:hypothetical protein
MSQSAAPGSRSIASVTGASATARSSAEGPPEGWAGAALASDRSPSKANADE